MKSIRYFFEGFALLILFAFFKICTPMTASQIGGWLGRHIGPSLAASRKARRHIKVAFPDIDKKEQDEIIKGMWDNLGRIIAEYPHLERISRNHTTIIDAKILKGELEKNQAAIFFGGHIGNWEINSVAVLVQLNHGVDITYRAPNNPWTSALLNKARTLNGRITGYPKSQESGRKILQAMKDKKTLGILIDQKYNQGLDVPFFGQSAMTNPIFVQLCQKYKCPLIPIRNERLNGCNFSVKTYPPITLFEDDGTPRKVDDIILEAHHIMEEWIKERPKQWIWLHRRWKDI